MLPDFLNKKSYLIVGLRYVSATKITLDTINHGTIGSTKLYTPISYVIPVNSFDSLK